MLLISWRGVLAWHWHLLAFFAGILWCFVCLLLGIALQHRPEAELRVSGLFLQFMCAPLHVIVVLLCVVARVSSVFGVC